MFLPRLSYEGSYELDPSGWREEASLSRVLREAGGHISPGEEGLPREKRDAREAAVSEASDKQQDNELTNHDFQQQLCRDHQNVQITQFRENSNQSSPETNLYGNAEERDCHCNGEAVERNQR